MNPTLEEENDTPMFMLYKTFQYSMKMSLRKFTW